MNLLLDSHALLWALYDPLRLRREAANAIRSAKRTVFFSAVSVWELELKAAKGKLKLPEQWLDAARETGFLSMGITPDEAQQSARLPWHHSDPFDRLLIVQAREHGLQIATRDLQISGYGVPVLEV